MLKTSASCQPKIRIHDNKSGACHPPSIQIKLSEACTSSCPPQITVPLCIHLQQLFPNSAAQRESPFLPGMTQFSSTNLLLSDAALSFPSSCVFASLLGQNASHLKVSSVSFRYCRHHPPVLHVLAPPNCARHYPFSKARYALFRRRERASASKYLPHITILDALKVLLTHRIHT